LRARLRPGDRLTVQSTQAPRVYRITGIAAPTTPVHHQTSLFFSAGGARRLAAHPGQVTAFGVLPAKGTNADRLRQAITTALHQPTARPGTAISLSPTAPLGSTAQVTSGDARGPVEFLDAATARTRLVSIGGAMGGTSLLVAVLVVVGTFVLSVQQRHRELALLRAVAATSGQIRRFLGREALIVGTVAGVAGALLGLPLGGWLYDRFVALGAVPATLQHTTGVVPPLAALVATALGAWTAARVASRRISRIRPAQALAEAEAGAGAGARTKAGTKSTRTRLTTRAGLTRGRLLAGLVLLAGGVVLVVVLSKLRTEPASTPVTFLAVVVLSTSVALLGPLLVKAAVLVLRGPVRRSGPTGRLATANLRGNAVRMASVATPPSPC
jgi:putative ABC transport system permease protein